MLRCCWGFRPRRKGTDAGIGVFSAASVLGIGPHISPFSPVERQFHTIPYWTEPRGESFSRSEDSSGKQIGTLNYATLNYATARRLSSKWADTRKGSQGLAIGRVRPGPPPGGPPRRADVPGMAGTERSLLTSVAPPTRAVSLAHATCQGSSLKVPWGQSV